MSYVGCQMLDYQLLIDEKSWRTHFVWKCLKPQHKMPNGKSKNFRPFIITIIDATQSKITENSY